MNISTDAILKMLNEGKTPDEIAKAMTNTLNEAIEAKKAQDELEASKSAKDANLNECTQRIIDDIATYIDIYYNGKMPAEIDKALADMPAKEVRSVLDGFLRVMDKGTVELFFKTPGLVQKFKVGNGAPTKIEKSDADVFAKFFSKHGLL